MASKPWFRKQPASLTFTVPAGDFPDGDTTTSVIAEYFDGNEEIVLSDAFVVYVPFREVLGEHADLGTGS